MMVLSVLAVLESTLPSFSLSFKMHKGATLAGSGGFGGYGGIGHDGYPLKLTPPFATS